VTYEVKAAVRKHGVPAATDVSRWRPCTKQCQLPLDVPSPVDSLGKEVGLIPTEENLNMIRIRKPEKRVEPGLSRVYLEQAQQLYCCQDGIALQLGWVLKQRCYFSQCMAIVIEAFLHHPGPAVPVADGAKTAGQQGSSQSVIVRTKLQGCR